MSTTIFINWVTIILLVLKIAVLKSESEFRKKGHVPTLLILGVQKGGSSSLYEFMIKHPLFCGGDVHKEPHFFDHDDQYKMGRAYFSSSFTDPKCNGNPKARYIDGTPQLHYMHKVADRLAEFYSEEERKKLKFIVLLREPVSRDYSWYAQQVRAKLAEGVKFTEIPTFQELDESVELQAEFKVHRSGRYVEQLEHFTDYFQRGQILVLNAKHVFQNSSDTMESVAAFLGVDMIPEWREPFPHDDHLGYTWFQGALDCIMEHVPSLSCSFRDQLAKYYEPYNKMLYEWIEASKGKAHRAEPLFDSFQDDYLTERCEKTPRSSYNQLIQSSKQESCMT